MRHLALIQSCLINTLTADDVNILLAYFSVLRAVRPYRARSQLRQPDNCDHLSERYSHGFQRFLSRKTLQCFTSHDNDFPVVVSRKLHVIRNAHQQLIISADGPVFYLLLQLNSCISHLSFFLINIHTVHTRHSQNAFSGFSVATLLFLLIIRRYLHHYASSQFLMQA